MPFLSRGQVLSVEVRYSLLFFLESKPKMSILDTFESTFRTILDCDDSCVGIYPISGLSGAQVSSTTHLSNSLLSCLQK